MIAIDTNLLVYAHREDSPFHAAADACVAQCAEARAAWAIPWPCLHEFYSIVTHPRIYNPPTPAARALEQIDAWLESPSLVLLTEGDRHWTTLRELVTKARIAGPAIHDARIAALCLQHGASELWSADRDFGRFSGLRVVNPLPAR
ncbi:MAG TPA: TA system VapC family ribonuclease toxin [Rubrivivax sp.]|nr:TA system VapC family ribonuclease toxin [Rubrivivax sp.]